MSFKIKTEPRRTTPDEAQLLSGMERLLVLVEQHSRWVLLAGTVLITVVAAVAAAVWYYNRQADEAMELTHQAMTLYLNRPADKPALADENLKKAVGQLRAVADQYPRTVAGQLALYHLGNALVQINDLSGAIEAYKKYVATYGANKNMLGLVYQRLGYAYLLNGDRSQAEKAFSAVLEVTGALNKDQALFELGKLEEAQSRPEGALARYQDLTKSYPASPFANEAAIRIKALEVKKAPEGTQPAEPAAGAPAGSPPASAPTK
ncbi:MAG: tetratricopeptide repeat protein [Nitrospirota bacterium]